MIQELLAENDYLKKQSNQLRLQLDQIDTDYDDKINERVNQQKMIFQEAQQIKEQEVQQLINLVNSYEEEIKELQFKIEEQIYIQSQRDETNHNRNAQEQQAQQEIQQLRLLLQEFILVKDNVEKQMEELVKQILQKDDCNNDVDKNLNSKPQATSISKLNKFKEGFSNRKLQDIMRCEIQEMRELLEVIKELSALILQMITEKKQIKAQLNSELELRNQIENALESQAVDGLSQDLLIMKIKTLEHVLNSIQKIFNQPQQQEGSAQYLIYQQLRSFSNEQIDERVRLQERLKSLEKENLQQREDIENLLSRVAECERENTEMRISGDKILEEEKKKLLVEVEEIRKREEQMEQEIQIKFEQEIAKMQQEIKNDINQNVVKAIEDILKIQSTLENDIKVESYADGLKMLELKFKQLHEKIEVLSENKELLMQERIIFEERLQELAYENQTQKKQLDQLQLQLQTNNYNFQQDLQLLRDDRDQINANANLLMTKFRQTASELHEVREEREKLRIDLLHYKEIMDKLDRRSSLTSTIISSQQVQSQLQSSIVLGVGERQPNSLMSTQYSQNFNQNRPPLSNIKSDHTNSPSHKQQSQARYNNGLSNSSAKKDPIFIYQGNSNTTNLIKSPQQFDIVPQYNLSSQNTLQPSRGSYDEKQLSSLIKDYKTENQKFSQKVQELQKKIQSTAQLSPLNKQTNNSSQNMFINTNNKQTATTSNVNQTRASSSKPYGGNYQQMGATEGGTKYLQMQSNSNNTIQDSRNAQNSQQQSYFSSLNSEDYYYQNSTRIGSAANATATFRNQSCTVKKNQQ